MTRAGAGQRRLAALPVDTSDWISVALAIVATAAAVVAGLAYGDTRRTNRRTREALNDERDEDAPA